MRTGNSIVIPRGNSPKPIDQGDIVLFHDRVRLICDVGKSMISFRASAYWDGDEVQNPRVWYNLPVKVKLLKRATDDTFRLAERFNNWTKEIPVPDSYWKKVCDLQVAAIKCECE